MKKLLIWSSVILAIFAGTIIYYKSQSTQSKSSFLFRYPITTWARKSPVEIGCMLEKEFGYNDSIFNCSNTNYVNDVDVCENPGKYYEGIKIPDELVSKIDPYIKSINLIFEHGLLQDIWVIPFKDAALPKEKVREKFNLPSDNNLPSNVWSLSFGDDLFSGTVGGFAIQGFEHMDSNCSGEGL
jgi:hypothetical protein